MTSRSISISTAPRARGDGSAASLRERQGIVEAEVLSVPAAGWSEAVAKARYVLNLYAASLSRRFSSPRPRKSRHRRSDQALRGELNETKDLKPVRCSTRSRAANRKQPNAKSLATTRQDGRGASPRCGVGLVLDQGQRDLRLRSARYRIRLPSQNCGAPKACAEKGLWEEGPVKKKWAIGSASTQRTSEERNAERKKSGLRPRRHPRIWEYHGMSKRGNDANNIFRPSDRPLTEYWSKRRSVKALNDWKPSGWREGGRSRKTLREKRRSSNWRGCGRHVPWLTASGRGYEAGWSTARAQQRSSAACWALFWQEGAWAPATQPGWKLRPKPSRRFPRFRASSFRDRLSGRNRCHFFPFIRSWM